MEPVLTCHPSILSDSGKHPLDYSLSSVKFNEEGELLIEVKIPSSQDNTVKYDVLFPEVAAYFVEQEESSYLNEVPRSEQVCGIGVLEGSPILNYLRMQNRIFEAVHINTKHYVIIGGDRVCHVLSTAAPQVRKRC